MDERIERLDYHSAKRFIERWHYSGRIPKGRNICYGLWLDGELYAVIVYGNGVNPYQAQYLGVERYVELKRMCRTEPRKNYQLSRFIRRSAKMAQEVEPHEAIVAFADPEHGHEGGVYRATGFSHEGRTQAEWHLVGPDGEKRHRRIAYRASRRMNCSIAEARERLGFTRVKTEPKHRWVLRTSSGSGR